MSVSKVSGFLALIVLMGSLGTAGLGSVQYAWAAPGVTCLVSSTIAVTDGFISKTCWGTPGVGEAPHSGGAVVIYRTIDDAGLLDTTVTLGSAIDCTTFAVAGTGGADGLTDAFLLDNAGVLGVQPNFYAIPGSTVGPSYPPGPIAGVQDSITFSFPSAPGPIITSITADGTAPPPSLADGSAWVQIGTGSATPALTVGSWRFDTCAIDSNGNTGGDNDQFKVQKPVGGEILSIDTTALLIAGAQQNGIWILSSLATIAGVSFVLLRFQVTKKNN